MDIHFHAGAPEELALAARFLTDLAAIRSQQIAESRLNQPFFFGPPTGELLGAQAAGQTQQLNQQEPNVKPAKDTGSKPGKSGKEPKPNPTAPASTTSPAAQDQQANTSAASPAPSSAPSIEDVRKKISVLTDGEDTRKALSALMKNDFKVTSLVDLPADQRVTFLERAQEIAEKAGFAWTA